MAIVAALNLGIPAECQIKSQNARSVDHGIKLEKLWNEKDYIKLSEIAATVKYMVLERSPKSLLPEEGILSVKLSGNRLLVTSSPAGNIKIHVFDMQGQYLFDIGQFGKGPGEFVRPSVEYDPINELFWVLDTRQDKLIKYGNGGILHDEYSVDKNAKKIAINSKGFPHLLCLAPRDKPDQSEVQVWNSDGEILDHIPLYQDREPGTADLFSISAFFEFIQDDLYFNEGPFRNGYRLNNQQAWDIVWSLDQGKHALPAEKYWGDLMSFIGGPAVGQVIETPSYLFIGGFYKQSASKRFVYSKASHQTAASHIAAETENLSDIGGLYNDFDGGLPFWPSGPSPTGEFVQINDAQRYLDLLNGKLRYHSTKEKTPLSPKLKSFCESLDPEDNPVVMVVTFK